MDLNSEMLDVARKIPLKPGKAASIEWREGDAGAMSFEEEFFDVVFCGFGLMFFPDRIAALKEMRRVLRLKGAW